MKHHPSPSLLLQENRLDLGRQTNTKIPEPDPEGIQLPQLCFSWRLYEEAFVLRCQSELFDIWWDHNLPVVLPSQVSPVHMPNERL